MDRQQPQTGMYYICGSANCRARNELKQRDAIKCTACGYRIMYKERTRRMVQFQAR
ncbi:hypothetical protein CAOG_00504 [Capsaspora owczarzaki ATCC 30864]|uniref:Uncharacterized protein n=1 Tax=Capsaspora owczarzaki (strain ATCC 30864) TaxID=595528 RepID=A0A0D2U134_CAPO3|nr:hypothetical protein CAOG_00504 [Capsaspora owczarzaki ATCC 30864]KJE88936.1 hypothetical protein CAOG_000504 [Capsaspora owczarzaki ATCC 30864]|eukprot:XP_004365375.1 hypothetical protein CAOG_00504 [Capsaspora owczarzaki ATCC 30864]